jgi:hypothetical protein
VSDLIAIQKAMLTVYENNMKYLKKFDKPLYKKVQKLSKDIETNTFEENYAIEFTNGHFNLLNLTTNQYTYPINALQYATKEEQKFSFDMSNTFNTLNPEWYNFNKKENIQESLSYNQILAQHIFAYNDYTNIQVDNPHKNLSHISKFIFVGTGLASHLLSIHKKAQASNYLIVEPSLEIFRLSLFVTDYNELAKDAYLEFCIEKEDEELQTNIQNFLEISPYTNSIIKFHLLNNHYKSYLEDISIAISLINTFDFHYGSMLDLIEHTVDKLQKNYNILETKNIEWIKKNQHHFITLAFGASINKLSNYGIKVDIISNVDGKEAIYTEQFAKIDKSYFNNTILLASAYTNQQVLECFDKKNVFLFESYFGYKENSYLNFSGWSVGEITYHLLLTLNIQYLYLIGTDMSLGEDGSTHDKGHHATQKVDFEKQLDNNIFYESGKIDFKQQTMKVKGNFNNEVITTPWFNRLIVMYNSITEQYHKKSQQFFNLSDGAYINGFTPKHIEEVKLNNLPTIDKKKLHKKLVSKFQKISSNELSQDELQNINKSIKQYTNALKSIKKFSTIEIMNWEDFNKVRMNLTKKIINKNSLQLNLPIGNYLKIYLNYFEYYINDSTLKNKHEKINHLYQIMLKHFTQIISIKKSYLEQLTKDNNS